MNLPFAPTYNKKDETPVVCKCIKSDNPIAKDDAKDMYCCNEQCPIIGTKYTCTACRAACYCSFECQKKDWPFHKKECTPYLIVDTHGIRHHHPNPRSLYQETISTTLLLENMGLCHIDEMKSISRRYEINWALKSIREASCSINSKGEILIIEKLAKRVPIVFRRLEFWKNVRLKNLKKCHIKELFLRYEFGIKNWDKFLLDIHTIKPELIVVDKDNFDKRFELINNEIAIKVQDGPYEIFSDTGFDAKRKKRKFHAMGILLYSARLKNDQSPFYKDNLCPDIFKVILSFVKRAIVQ